MERLTVKAKSNCGFVWALKALRYSAQDCIDRLAEYESILMDKNPEVSRLFYLSEIALNEKLERLVNGQSSGPLTREEAEAALKKREEARGE